MTKGRLEAFSDGVIAIIITIMVLELHVPHGSDWAALEPVLPVFLAYISSFVFVGIYWNNHHHLLHATERINGAIMWANQALLFVLSLVPFATAWMGEHPREPVPTALYGALLLTAGLSFWLLASLIVRVNGPESRVARALAPNMKGPASQVLYTAAIPAAWVSTWISDVLFVLVALLWLVPDRGIEKTFDEKQKP